VNTQTTRKIFHRDFILVSFAQFAFSASIHILIPTLPIYLARSGSKEAEIGVLIGTLSVSALVLRPFVGRALLRVSEKRFMTVGALFSAICCAAYIWAQPFWPFLIVRFFQGIGVAFFYTAAVVLVANISSERHRGQSLSYFYLSINIAFALAPTFGIFLMNHFSFPFLFSVCTGLLLCSLFISREVGKGQGDQADRLKDLSGEDSSFLSRKALPPSIMSFLANTIWGAVTAFFPLYAISYGVSNPGLFFTAYAIVMILGRILGGKILDLYSRDKVMFPCLVTYIVAMIIFAFSKTLPMFILVAVIWGMGSAFLGPALAAYTVDLAGSSRGPAMGTFSAAMDLGVGLGAMTMGVILRLTNYSTMFLCLALIGTVNLLYFYSFVRKKG
jgi:MFS family permease